MIRSFGAVMLALALAVAVRSLAQSPQPKQDGEDRLQKKAEPKKEAPKDEMPPVDEGTGEKPEEIIKRVQKNMTASAERLEQKDASEKTQEIQRDIVRDLEELIKQAEKQAQNPQGGGGGKSSPQQGSKSARGQGQKPASKSAGSKASQGNEPANANAGAKPGQGGKGKAPSPTEGEPANKEGASGSGGGNTAPKKEKNTVADLFKDIWGHLPSASRMEMDAYSREKFMSKYEDLLREYYRTIAERGRRQGD